MTKERPLIHVMVPFVPRAGLRSPPDCCSSVVYPEVALHPEHLHPLPVSVWEPLMGTVLFTFVSQHTHIKLSSFSMLLACPAYAWTARAL